MIQKLSCCLKFFQQPLLILILATCFWACNQTPENKSQPQKNAKPVNEKEFVQQVIAMDTLTSAQARKFISEQLENFNAVSDKESNPVYRYYQGRQFLYNDEKDSALAAFEAMDTVKSSEDVKLLRNYRILLTNTPNGGVVPAEHVHKLIEEMRKAESSKSQLTFAFYELLARCYFQNNNLVSANEYSKKSFEQNPFKDHKKVQQRYHDISFLLAGRVNDFESMTMHNGEARRLAIETKDSLALARTYDNEARIFALKGQPQKGVESGRQFLNYLIKNNSVTTLAYNNLATSFVRANQPDSAIHYYHKAIDLMNKEPLENHVPYYYNGLKETYQKKGDYQNSLHAADSAYIITLRNLKRVEATKVAEIHEKYQSVKKDRDIHDLKRLNALSKKSIRQQRWILITIALVIIIALAWLATMYRQRLLRNKNALLKEENKRLSTDRKMLQAQLNPHFIFNSIANLQGLISAGENDLSSKYLSTFSKLLRDILDQSRKDFIPLEEEVQSISNYLNLQQMRFPELFDYEINIDSKIDKETLLIPPMLLQPFIENSIEHGFRNIGYKGKLEVNFFEEGDRLLIDILDNGVGIESPSKQNSNKTSLSRIILKERLEALFNNSANPARFVVEDRKEQGLQGVKVKLNLPKTWD